MQTLPASLYTAEQTRAIDRILIDDYKLSATQLISRAATAALDVIRLKFPDIVHIHFLCGAGHNGADGLTLALKAKEQNFKVSIHQLGETDSLSDETKLALDIAEQHELNVKPFDDSIPTADLIVDAIFGTGLNKPISGAYKQAVERINKANVPVLSLDIASGLNADTGQIMGCAVKANKTISFIGLNIGLFTADGTELSGDIFFDDLGTPRQVYQQVPNIAERITFESYEHLLAPRHKNSHKGLFGHLLVIGGDTGMAGAVRLAAEAGARTGAGLTSIATRQHHAHIAQSRPELMCHGIETQEALTPLLNTATVLTLGPGLGQAEWGQLLYQQSLKAERPLVIDADGLNLLSQYPTHSSNWVLTPHPGEAARLLNCTTQEIQANRIGAIKQLQATYGGVIVLKGAGTLIYDGHHPVKVANYGNPGMSTGGMGDVLAGIIGSLIGQRHSLFDAACLGVILHGLAADKAALEQGERGMLAMDLLPHIRHLVNLRF